MPSIVTGGKSWAPAVLEQTVTVKCMILKKLKIVRTQPFLDLDGKQVKQSIYDVFKISHSFPSHYNQCTAESIRVCLHVFFERVDFTAPDMPCYSERPLVHHHHHHHHHHGWWSICVFGILPLCVSCEQLSSGPVLLGVILL